CNVAHHPLQITFVITVSRLLVAGVWGRSKSRYGYGAIAKLLREYGGFRVRELISWRELMKIVLRSAIASGNL
ncbi:MAG: hypothetical protein WBA10_00375, partial [Elainellaceae cyanobacterium]